MVIRIRFVMFFSVYVKAILLFFYLQSWEVRGESCTCEYLMQTFMVRVGEWEGMRSCVA